MPGQRAKDKKRFEGWILASLYDRVRGAAGNLTNTDVLNEALTDWADKHDATGTGPASLELREQPR